MSHVKELYKPKETESALKKFCWVFIAKHLHLHEQDWWSMSQRNYYYETVQFIWYILLLKRVVNITSVSCCASRVLETVQSVPTSKMDCSVCLDVPKACWAGTTCWCGNTLIGWKCASYATKTALEGKSIVQPTWVPTLHFSCVANICLSKCWFSSFVQVRWGQLWSWEFQLSKWGHFYRD